MAEAVQDEEVQRVYDEYWRSIVEPNGVVDMEQIKRELFDYHTVLEEVPVVYCHITNSRISKPNTHASAVIAVADEVAETAIEEAVQEAMQDARREREE